MIEDGQTKVETQSKQLVEKDKEIDEQKEHAIVISSEIKQAEIERQSKIKAKKERDAVRKKMAKKKALKKKQNEQEEIEQKEILVQ